RSDGRAQIKQGDRRNTLHLRTHSQDSRSSYHSEIGDRSQKPDTRQPPCHGLRLTRTTARLPLMAVAPPREASDTCPASRPLIGQPPTTCERRMRTSRGSTGTGRTALASRCLSPRESCSWPSSVHFLAVIGRVLASM